MRILSTSYINYEYNQKVIIDKWKNVYYNSTLGNDSLFFETSGYDYINMHLGYRLVIKSIEVRYDIGGKFELSINIENVGFGNLLKTKKVDIIYTDEENIIIKKKYIGKYNGENFLKINGEFLDKNHSKYKVFICLYGSIENNTVFYPIQFANDNIYDNDLKANFIFYVEEGGNIL